MDVPGSARAAAASVHSAPSATEAFHKGMHDLRHSPGAFPNVSARWLLGAAGIALIGAVVCAWLTLCLLYWQGSWQLLYHPRAAIDRTPASAGLAFEPVRFAVTETGVTQLAGWWLPSPDSRFTVLYLHGADGNLGDSVDALAALHHAGVAVLAFDYRGYGQSQPGRPGEKQLRHDAEWALAWLTLIRHIPARSILLYGTGLGANLAAELAADHGELAGIVLDQPLQNALVPVFSDPRSGLVPAHWLVKDRYDLPVAARQLKIPSLWLLSRPDRNQEDLGSDVYQDAYRAAQTRKAAAWLKSPVTADPNFEETLQRWMDDL